jgi:hypothetical protein
LSKIDLGHKAVSGLHLFADSIGHVHIGEADEKLKEHDERHRPGHFPAAWNKASDVTHPAKLFKAHLRSSTMEGDYTTRGNSLDFELVTSKGLEDLSQNRKRRVIEKFCADKRKPRRAARFHRHLHAESSLACSPVALRPPHPWPKAGHCAIASSLFCFERDPRDLSQKHSVSKI